MNTSIDFGLKPISDIVDGNVTLTNVHTRCNTEVPFWLDIRNEGTVVSDAIVSLKIDSLTEFVSASITPDSIVGKTIYWNVENIIPTYGESIMIVLKMPSVDHLGEWLSFQAITTLINPINGIQYSRAFGLRSQVNCAYDPNDKLVEPNIPDLSLIHI